MPINRMKTSFVFLSHLVLVMGGGATPAQSQETPPPPDTIPQEVLETILDGQEEWLLSLNISQSIEGFTLPAMVLDPNDPTTNVGIDFYYALEVSYDGNLYQYIRAMYPRTDTLYGLYFVEGELAGLLLEQNARDFANCESSFRAGRPPRDWDQDVPPYDIDPVNEWVRQRNLLGTEFDARIFHVPQRSREDDEQTDSGDTVAAIVHVPIAIMALPAYAASFLPPVRWLIRMGDRRWERKRQRWANSARQIRPGTSTEEDLREVMGRPLRRREWRDGTEWQYERGYADLGASEFHFGVRNGLVEYKEITGEVDISILRGPRNPLTRMSSIRECGELRMPWAGRKTGTKTPQTILNS